MSHGSPVALELQLRGFRSVESGPVGTRDAGPYLPSTRLIHCSVQLEGLLKIVETDHLLIQCVHLNAAQVARESEGLRRLWVESTVRTPSCLLEISGHSDHRSMDFSQTGPFSQVNTGRCASTLQDYPEAAPGSP